jgi:hypothetical protein
VQPEGLGTLKKFSDLGGCVTRDFPACTSIVALPDMDTAAALSWFPYTAVLYCKGQHISSIFWVETEGKNETCKGHAQPTPKRRLTSRPHDVAFKKIKLFAVINYLETRHRWEDNIKMCLKSVDYEDLFSSGSGERSVASSCDHGNGSFGPVKGGTFLD